MRSNGCYVRFTREEAQDLDSNPREYLFQDPDYRDEDEARLAAWQAGKWCFIGVRARAHIEVVSHGNCTLYTLTSPGLWGIESDSGDDYLQAVFEEEKSALLADLRSMGNPVEVGC